MVTPFTDETLTLNGFRMHYLDWGNASAPPLLMVHGLTRQAHAFDGVALALSSALSFSMLILRLSLFARL